MSFRTTGNLSYSQAKKVCKFYFSKFFAKIDKNEKEALYEIYLSPGLEDDFVNYFAEFWGSGYQIYKWEPSLGIDEDNKTPYIEKEKATA